MYKILFAFICMSVFFASDLMASANTDGNVNKACPAMKVKRDQLQDICMAVEVNQPGGCQPFKAEITKLDTKIKDECKFWEYSKKYPGGVVEKSCDCADDFTAVLRKFQKERDSACGTESRALMTKLRDLDDFKLAKERSDYLSRWFSGGGSTSDVHFKQFVTSAQWKSCSKRAYDKVMLEASDQLIEQLRSSGLSERDRSAVLSDWFKKTDGVTDDIIDSFDPWTHATYRASAVYWNTVMTTLQSKNTLDAFLPGAYDAVGEFFGYTISDEQRTGERPALDRIGNAGHVVDAAINPENSFAQYGPVLGVLFSQANLSEQEKFDLTNASTDALAVLGKVSDSISNGPYESYSENVAHAIKNFKPEEHSGDIGRSLNAIITIQKLARKHAGETLTPAQENTFKALEQLVNVVTKTSELINTIDQNEENLNAALNVLDPANDRESIAVIKSAGQFQIAETAIETVGEIWKSGDLIVDIFGSKQQQTSWKAVSAKVKLALDATSNATGSWNDSGVLVNYIQNTDNAVAYDKAQRDIVKLYGELGEKHFGASPSAASCACDQGRSKVKSEVATKEKSTGTCSFPEKKDEPSNSLGQSCSRVSKNVDIASQMETIKSEIYDQQNFVVRRILSHWDRNAANHQPQVSYSEMQNMVASGDALQLSDSASIFHQYSSDDNSNEKYISKDGHFEWVYDSEGTLLLSGADAGSFNHVGPYTGPEGGDDWLEKGSNLVNKFSTNAKHVSLDVLPYYVYGNNSTDKTSIYDRAVDCTVLKNCRLESTSATAKINSVEDPRKMSAFTPTISTFEDVLTGFSVKYIEAASRAALSLFNATATITEVSYDFAKNYTHMRSANRHGADKFFHCKANCQGTRRGLLGKSVAEKISLWREDYDEFMKGDNPEDRAQDEEANLRGRVGATKHPDLTCSEVCAEYIPPGLERKYIDSKNAKRPADPALKP